MLKYSHNQEITLFGKNYLVQFKSVATPKPVVQFSADSCVVYAENNHHETALFSNLKKISKKYLLNRVQELADRHNFEYNDVRVKGQRTRWGSCSSKKNLNFNWRLIHTSKECIDYVIIHELAHTVHMNHSRNFWNLVEQFVPNYRVIKNSLREKEKAIFYGR